VTELALAAGMKPVPTGIAHGTVTVVHQGQPFEVTTLRRDVATDGRHATVAFATTIADDAARRDFTMNALYADIAGNVQDPVGGLPDLSARIIRFIGDPEARIAEDYLRILRFFRFHAVYGDPEQGIEQEGLAACAARADGLEALSRERVGAEMLKLLAAPDPSPAVAAMGRSGVLWRILPGAGANVLPVLVHVEEVAGLSPDPLRRMAILGGEGAADALRLSKAQSARLARLTAAMEDEATARALGYHHGADEALDVLALRAALSGRELDPDMADLARQGAAQLFPVTAADLPSLHGPALGQALRDLKARWLADDFLPTRETLLADHARKGVTKPDA
jgi:poly(A) polymerase